MAGRRATTADVRFDEKWKRDPVTGCHVWQAGITQNGYGKFWKKPRMMLAHHYAWLRSGKRLEENFDLCHSCDNRACVNPKHCFIGTRFDNMKDAKTKGRLKRVYGSALQGESHHQAKLNESEVRTIRRRYAGGSISQTELARMFRVSIQQIHRIIHHKSWTNV